MLHMIKERCSKLRTRIDDPSKIIKKIGKNILPTFKVKDLRPYHGEDLRASLFPNDGGLMQELFDQSKTHLILSPFFMNI